MLVGEKITLGEVDPENIEQLRMWRNDPSMRKFFREWKDISKDKQQQWYEERGNNTNPSHIYFQIKSKNKLIGCCGLHYIDWRIRSVEFSIFLGVDRGQGKGKEALVLMCDYAFKEVGVHKVWCEVYDNNPSVNLYKKVGFVEEGVLRDNYYHEGKYGNSIIMSVLENEWRAKYGDGVLWGDL